MSVGGTTAAYSDGNSNGNGSSDNNSDNKRGDRESGGGGREMSCSTLDPYNINTINESNKNSYNSNNDNDNNEIVLNNMNVVNSGCGYEYDYDNDYLSPGRVVGVRFDGHADDCNGDDNANSNNDDSDNNNYGNNSNNDDMKITICNNKGNNNNDSGKNEVSNTINSNNSNSNKIDEIKDIHAIKSPEKGEDPFILEALRIVNNTSPRRYISCRSTDPYVRTAMKVIDNDAAAGDSDDKDVSGGDGDDKDVAARVLTYYDDTDGGNDDNGGDDDDGDRAIVDDSGTIIPVSHTVDTAVSTDIPVSRCGLIVLKTLLGGHLAFPCVPRNPKNTENTESNTKDMGVSGGVCAAWSDDIAYDWVMSFLDDRVG